jgi:hypothetical protein
MTLNSLRSKDVAQEAVSTMKQPLNYFNLFIFRQITFGVYPFSVFNDFIMQMGAL